MTRIEHVPATPPQVPDGRSRATRLPPARERRWTTASRPATAPIPDPSPIAARLAPAGWSGRPATKPQPPCPANPPGSLRSAPNAAARRRGGVAVDGRQVVAWANNQTCFIDRRSAGCKQEFPARPQTLFGYPRQLHAEHRGQHDATRHTRKFPSARPSVGMPVAGSNCGPSRGARTSGAAVNNERRSPPSVRAKARTRNH